MQQVSYNTAPCDFSSVYKDLGYNTFGDGLELDLNSAGNFSGI